MSAIIVGCPKCRSHHSVEVWSDTNCAVDENIDCSCGIEFSVCIMIISQEEEQDNDVDILGGLFGDISDEELASKLGFNIAEKGGEDEISNK